MGNAAFGLGTRFFLTTGADVTEPIEVVVNGGVVGSGWRYDPASQSVVFDAPPPPRADIRIRYTPDC